MPKHQSLRRVNHPPDRMFSLVADIESYPEFVPMCAGLRVRERKMREGVTVLVADMAVGYKSIRETFTTQVSLHPAERRIDVRYMDGPFRFLQNHWSFAPIDEKQTDVHFFIEYEFKNRILGAVAGTMFELAFSRLSEAFERRADLVYGSST